METKNNVKVEEISIQWAKLEGYALCTEYEHAYANREAQTSSPGVFQKNGQKFWKSITLALI